MSAKKTKKKLKIVKTDKGFILKERMKIGEWKWWANIGGMFSPTVWKTKKEVKNYITKKYKNFEVKVKTCE